MLYLYLYKDPIIQLIVALVSSSFYLFHLFSSLFSAFRRMGPTRVLILRHSFIHRLTSFLLANYNLVFLNNFHLGNDLEIRWRGIGKRTVANTIKYDLGVVEKKYIFL